MELKTLVLGMFIAMSAFSVKVGIGWSYLCSRRPPGQKIALSCAVLTGYAILFAVLYLVVSRVNILAHYELFLPLWSSGVTLHWITAILIFVWGLYLLKAKREKENCENHRSKAWIALVIPCPVCASVILMSASCLSLYFPDEAAYAVAGLFALFITAAALGGFVVSYGGAHPEEALAQAMILISLYFIVSALVIPQFGEIGNIYRLAVYSGETMAAASSEGWSVFCFIILLLAAGFFYGNKEFKNRRRYPV